LSHVNILNCQKKIFEILIVDNQSTDDSISTIEKLGEKITNIRLWKNSTNVGRIGNWNTVLEKAEGDYLFYYLQMIKYMEKITLKKFLKFLMKIKLYHYVFQH